jgi:hypothetical protein
LEDEGRVLLRGMVVGVGVEVEGRVVGRDKGLLLLLL